MGASERLRLSVLDQSPIRAGGTAAQALAESVELARFVDGLGYHRYWFAEHHGSDGLAGPSPEIMIARVAAVTSRIRVGSGGVMLPHYSPFKVAETFRVLEAMYPGRIDLGIGRAPGSDYATSRALAYGSQITADYFPSMVQDLDGWLNDSLPVDHPLAQIRALPKTDSTPPIWLLGSSDFSGLLAAALGLPFSFAHFISPAGGEFVMRAYRERFRPSPRFPVPQGNIGLFVICADTDEEAERIAATRDLQRLRADRGDRGPMPSVEEALAYRYSDAERAHVQRNRARTLVGGPDGVRVEMLSLAARYEVDEIVVLTNVYDFAARKRSYALLAEAFGLRSEATDAAAE